MADWLSQTHLTSDGYPVQYRYYPAQGQIRGDVVCIHGIQSHAGWYESSSLVLAQSGYNVTFLERRGSGQNQKDRGDTPGFRRLLADVKEFLTELQQRRFGTPIVLMGISWGGKIAQATEGRYPGLIDGLALLCPGFCPRVSPTLFDRLAILRSRLLHPQRLFEVPLNEPELFTSTPHWIEYLRKDPVALRQATARFFLESVRLDQYLRFLARPVRVPTLLLLAGQDRIIDNHRTRQFLRRCRGPLSIIEYPDAHHTLEFEPKPEVYLGDIRYWLGSIRPRQGAVSL